MSLKLTREVWTDGSVDPNPGFGGWAVVNEDHKVIERGWANLTTNIAMEGMAIKAAIAFLGDRPGIIHTDSQFWVKAMYVWGPRWASNGWRQPLNNVPLAKAMYEALRDHVSIEWVRGHAGDPGNEAADYQAGIARRMGENIYAREHPDERIDRPPAQRRRDGDGDRRRDSGQSSDDREPGRTWRPGQLRGVPGQ